MSWATTATNTAKRELKKKFILARHSAPPLHYVIVWHCCNCTEPNILTIPCGELVEDFAAVVTCQYCKCPITAQEENDEA